MAEAGSQSGKHSVHTYIHTYATHLLEDGMDIITLKDLLIHQNIETTMDYCKLPNYRANKI
jgi:site-specific recombinase XerD